MKQVQRGFTLIELVMVIVILGVLAAVAIPRFVDLRGDAQTAALQGVAGGIASASAVNFAARSVSVGNGFATAGATCANAANGIMQGGAIPTGYVVGATGPANVGAAGVTTTCVLTQTATGNTAGVPIVAIN